ncbi:hypothetical protein F5Y15DRAFT_384935 [Xylariaceae sp. FL0016]|nr:hypothetical protein F5Y15DRAFT_384935 [Xylariaceae sp. FL0016]
METASTSNASGGSGGKKVVDKFMAARRRWKKQPSSESFASTVSNEEYPRGRSPNTREPLRHDSVSTTQSSELASDAAHDDEREYDENDAYHSDSRDLTSKSNRPTGPSTHPSQIGQLTTSSPIIQAAHIPEIQLQDQHETPEALPRPVTHTASSGAPSSSGDKTALKAPLDPSSRRSKSPTGRVKDAFRGKRNASAASSSNNQSELSDRDSKSILGRANAGLTPISQPDSSRSAADDARVASRRQKLQTPIDTTARPQTPPSEPGAPVIVNTPPTPTESHHSKSRPSSASSSHSLNAAISQTGHSIAHRRMRSGSGSSIGPSKLSNIISAPLTPTPEDSVASPGAGFFSSVLSAAQNAATTLSSTVTNNSIGIGGNKPKGTIPEEPQAGGDDRVEVEPSVEGLKTLNMGSKELAVKTLGNGDLSLSQLGINDTGSATPTPTASRFSEPGVDTRFRSDSAPADAANAPIHADGPSEELGFDRPKSLYEPTASTPPTSVYEGKSGIHRSGSIRSAISRRRKRGSTGGTAATGASSTIGAAIAAANASVAHPHAAGSAPKLTGFAVASKKRNRDFHALFKSVPDDDYLIEDYSCALQREILAHGRLYVSEGHLCFSSNIFGWVTTLVMSFDEIVSVEKRSTALVFKNGLMITTLHARHVFASFTSRDNTYDLIVNIWKLGHPTLRSSLNGVSLDETGGDKTEKVEDGETMVRSPSASGSEDDASEDGEEVYDEDQEDDDLPQTTQATDFSPVETDGEKAVARKVSGAIVANGGADKADAPPAGPGIADFPGPATHAPTDCGDLGTHYDISVGDEVVPAPLGKVYNLIFGPASVNFMSKWLTIEQKCTDLQMEDKKGLTNDNKSRSYTYIKPLYASLGPKQTKCIVTESIDALDLEKAVHILVVTQTPDVPSGNVFSVKTRYCLSWADNNSTHVSMTCVVEWTGKSWLKGPIEKGAKDGQTDYWRDLSTSVKGAISSRPRAGTLNGGLTKGKKKRAKGKLQTESKDNLRGPTVSAASKTENWGLFEPLHGILGPIFDILKPVLTGNVVYGLLVGLLVASWFGFGFNGQPRGAGFGRDLGLMGYPDRAVAYEEMWRREESDLWDWLEERVGLHRMNEEAVPIRKRAMDPRTAEEKLRLERTNEKEVQEAIRVTEEKLQVLKQVMERKKEVPKSGSPGKLTTEVPAAER